MSDRISRDAGKRSDGIKLAHWSDGQRLIRDITLWHVQSKCLIYTKAASAAELANKTRHTN